MIDGQSSRLSRSRRWRLVKRTDTLEAVCAGAVDAYGLLIAKIGGQRHHVVIQQM